MRKKSEEKRSKPADVVKVPIDTTSEAVLIGAVVNDETARSKWLNALSPDHFFGPGHALMWRSLRELYRQGLEYSASAANALADGIEVLALEEYVRGYRERGANLRIHVERVKWNKARRDAADGPVADFLESFRDPAATPTAIVQQARRVVESFDGHGDTSYLRSSEEIVQEHSRELRERREGRALYPYGLPGLDFFGPTDFVDVKVERSGVFSSERRFVEGKPRIIPGARPGDVTVITGESGHGKTTAMVRMILEMCATRRVLWGAWEQQNGPSLELLATLALGFSRTDLMSGRFSVEDERDLLSKMRELGQRVRFFDLPFGRSAEEERRYNRENLNVIAGHVAESGCDVFVADLFSDALEQTDPDDEAQALKRIKAVAIENRCHVFLVHWLRHKGLADREDKRPTRDLVQGSGAWIGKSDNVLAFFRPGLYSGDDDRLECHVLKQRHGAFPLAVEFDWNGEYGSIENGRTLVLAKPGEEIAMDGFLGEAAPAKPRYGRKRR